VNRLCLFFLGLHQNMPGTRLGKKAPDSIPDANDFDLDIILKVFTVKFSEYPRPTLSF